MKNRKNLSGRTVRMLGKFFIFFQSQNSKLYIIIKKSSVNIFEYVEKATIW